MRHLEIGVDAHRILKMVDGCVKPALLNQNDADIIVGIFGAPSASVAALAAARTRTVSRLEELGLPEVSAQMVDTAKNGGY